MGSRCTTARHTRVVCPILVIKGEITSPLSGETYEKSPDTEAPPEKTNHTKRKRSSLDWEIRTPRSEVNGEKSSLGYFRNTERGNDLDTIKEDGLNDTNATKLRLGDFSPLKKTFEYKKGPIIDSNNSYAEVCECLDLNQGDRLAVKSYKIYGDMNKIRDYLEDMQEEIAILQDIDHVNLIEYYGMDAHEVKEPSHMIVDIIMEYASGGSVWGLVCKFNSLDERLIKTYTKQILEGLSYLHSEGILHGNLKSSNVLIDSNGVIKLTDVDAINNIKYLLLENPQEDNHKDILTGSIYWTAPEILIHNKAEKASDIWSVGCVVMEMLTGVPPWGLKTTDEAFKLLTSQKLPMFPKDISDTCRDFLQKIFRFDPEERFSIAELLEHPFLNEKNSDHSSVFETLQTLQSLNQQKGNNLLRSLNSLNNNNSPDWSSNDMKGISPNEIQPSGKRPSKTKNPNANFLSRVFETNKEEECSPMERDEFGKNIIQKGRWFTPGTVSNQLSPNIKQNSLKKLKTDDLNPVNEELDQEDNPDLDGEKSPTEEDGDRIDGESNIQSPFVPIKASIFKTLKSGENFIEVSGNNNERSQENEFENKTKGMTNEERRRALEEEMMKELEIISSKDISQISENNQSLTNKHFVSNYQDFVVEVFENEGQKSRYSQEDSKRLENNKTRDSGNDSVPFKDSRSSTVVKLENLSGEYEFNQDKEERRRKIEEEIHKKLEKIKLKNLTNAFFRSSSNESKNSMKQSIGDKSKSTIKLESLNSKESQEQGKIRETPDTQKGYDDGFFERLEIVKSQELFRGSPNFPENKSFAIKIESMDSQKFDQIEKEQRKKFGEEFQKQLEHVSRSQSPTPNQSVMSLPFYCGELDVVSELNKSSTVQQPKEVQSQVTST